MPTERECVLRERRAFEAGVTAGAGLNMSLGEAWSGSDREAAKRYPLRVTRVVQMNFPHVVWFKVEGGALLCRAGDDLDWVPASHSTWSITPELVQLWADLYANPTEEVEA